MEKKKIAYSKDDVVFKKFGVYAPVVATYANIVLGYHPDAEKAFMERIDKATFKIKSGEKVNFLVLGEMQESYFNNKIIRGVKLFTDFTQYDIDLSAPDFSKHFELLEKPYVDKKIIEYAKRASNNNKLEVIKTFIHELNHLTCYQSNEYYKNDRLLKMNEYSHSAKMNDVLVLDCVGGVPRRARMFNDENNYGMYTSGYLFHEGVTEILAHKIINNPLFTNSDEFRELNESQSDVVYINMTKIMEIENFLTNNLFFKCYWGDYKKDECDCEIVNEKLAEFDDIAYLMSTAQSCGLDEDGNFKEEETIKEELKQYFRTFLETKNEYVKLLKAQVNKRCRSLHVDSEVRDKYKDNIEFLSDDENWFDDCTCLMYQFSLEEKRDYVLPIFFATVAEMAKEKNSLLKKLSNAVLIK